MSAHAYFYGFAVLARRANAFYSSGAGADAEASADFG